MFEEAPRLYSNRPEQAQDHITAFLESSRF